MSKQEIRPINGDELLSGREAAEVIGIAYNTLKGWRYARQGPVSFKVGAKVVYRRSEIEKWLTEQERATATGGRSA